MRIKIEDSAVRVGSSFITTRCRRAGRFGVVWRAQMLRFYPALRLDLACCGLGSPVVPFTLFFASGCPYKMTNPKKGALVIMIWLLGFGVSLQSP